MSDILTALSFFIDGHGDITEKFRSFKYLGGMASSRIQLLPALMAAKECNLNINIASLHSTSPEDVFELKKSKICLLGKMSANTEPLAQSMIVANLAAAIHLKNQGSKIVIQYCDNMFHKNDLISEFYRDLFKLADNIIFPSKHLYTITREHINPETKSHIINDPWQLAKSHFPRKLVSGKACKIIWFGSNKNIDYLIECLSDIFKFCNTKINFELTILANAWSINRAKNFLLGIKKSYPNWTIRLVEWSYHDQPQQLENEISRAHISIIPSNPNDLLKSGVSHNRAVDSLRGGCITLASPMESYKELSNIIIIGNNMPEMINHALADYNKHCKNLTKCREQILSRFSPEQNKINWLNCWKTILDN